MKTDEEMTKEWYDLLFQYPQFKDITTEDKKTLTDYLDSIAVVAMDEKEKIFKRLEEIIWDLVWPSDDIIQVFLLTGVLQETAMAIWTMNDKKLPDPSWLIDNYLDHWIKDPKNMCEPMFPNGSDNNKNFHEAMGGAQFRIINRYANHVINKMKEKEKL